MATRNISKEKRERLINKIKEQSINADDETKAIFNEVINELNRKKYGIVREEHSEEVEDEMRKKIPVFTIDKERQIEKSKDIPYSFIIQGDNLHALYLLQKTHKHKIDCIYIDPPYNTGAKDWKYNNNYVDSNDTYRHSKWLSMMEHRLRLSKQLLNPKDSVLIVTIDEKEFLHLGCLLEEIFQGAKIQMISSVINHGSVARDNEFNRNNEYIFFVMIGDFRIQPLEESKNFLAGDGVQWRTLRRTNASNLRSKTKTQFYPIYVDVNKKTIKEIGQPLPKEMDVTTVKPIGEYLPVFPIRDDGTEMMWGLTRDELINRMSKGYVRVTNYNPKKKQICNIEYLPTGTIQDIESGIIETQGYNEDGSIIAVFKKGKAILPKTQWDNVLHDARDQGTKVLKTIFGSSPFSFPKSLYAVHDCLKYFISTKQKAIVLDFFAGSGTTQQAVNLLNAEDGGSRTCIMVTNNEVSEEEAKNLKNKGYKPGDEEWENLGIAKYVTWPRTVCTIEGIDIKGNPLKDNYIGSDIPMADGFKCNVMYYKTEFVHKKRDGSVPKTLLKHVKELIQLENHCKIDNKIIRVALSEDDVDKILESDLTDCKKLYIPTDVLLTSNQKEVVKNNKIEVIDIPEYYFAEELREVDEV